MKKIAALAISISMLFAQRDRAALHTVTSVHTTTLPGLTRISVEVSGDFRTKSDRLHEPERIYFDILNAHPRIDSKAIWSKDLNDKLVQRVRVAETQPGRTRIVVDLTGAADVTTTQLSSPNRLIIEVRAEVRAPVTSTTPATAPVISTASEPAPLPVSNSATPAPLAADPLPISKAEPEPMRIEPVRSENSKSELSKLASMKPEPIDSMKPEPIRTEPAKLESPKLDPVKSDLVKPALSKRELSKAEPPPPVVRALAELSPAPAAIASATPAAESGKAARHTSTGGSSLTRALGLKITRIVIDAGHGGHDQGTEGPHGLLEKELVLDVALRLGKLVEERMSAEVIYTRSDDTFVPLEGRTAIANQKKADLFLSIHANSSSIPRISGVETFYLNFTDSKDALDVASRENASSQKSIFELQDIIQKITLHEKLDESREFAGRIQSSLYSLSSRNVPGQKNRGVKKAPFVVLIGASMPSVLAEIGFITNPREEALLKKSDYRQKVAETLYRGVSKYAESLSHFQMAQN
jgi:N-acetylmuramoyl-L-alanine amidase